MKYTSQEAENLKLQMTGIEMQQRSWRRKRQMGKLVKGFVTLELEWRRLETKDEAGKMKSF